MSEIIVKLRDSDLKLLIDEANCRTITAIHSIKASDQLSQKLKDIALKLAKWGQENDSQAKMGDIRKGNKLFTDARTIIVEEEPDYSTDDEYATECFEPEKNKQSVEQMPGRRGKSKATILKEGEQKDIESLYGPTPAPTATRPVPAIPLRRTDMPGSSTSGDNSRRNSASTKKEAPQPKAKAKAKATPKAMKKRSKRSSAFDGEVDTQWRLEPMKKMKWI